MPLPHGIQNILNMIGFQVTNSEHAAEIVKDLADRLSADHLAQMIEHMKAKLDALADAAKAAVAE